MNERELFASKSGLITSRAMVSPVRLRRKAIGSEFRGLWSWDDYANWTLSVN